MKQEDFKLGMKVIDAAGRKKTVIAITEFLVNDKQNSPTNFSVMVGSDMSKEGKYLEGRWYTGDKVRLLKVTH